MEKAGRKKTIKVETAEGWEIAGLEKQREKGIKEPEGR